MCYRVLVRYDAPRIMENVRRVGTYTVRIIIYQYEYYYYVVLPDVTSIGARAVS